MKQFCHSIARLSGHIASYKFHFQSQSYVKLLTEMLLDVVTVREAADSTDSQCDQIVQTCLSELLLKLKDTLSEMSGDTAFDILRTILTGCEELQVDLDPYCSGFDSSLVQHVAHSDDPSQIFQAMIWFSHLDFKGIESISSLAEGDLLTELGAEAVKCDIYGEDADDEDDASYIFDSDSRNIDIHRAIDFVHALAALRSNGLKDFDIGVLEGLSYLLEEELDYNFDPHDGVSREDIVKLLSSSAEMRFASFPLGLVDAILDLPHGLATLRMIHAQSCTYVQALEGWRDHLRSFAKRSLSC